MASFDLAKEYLKPYAAKWQVLNRGEWQYAFHEKTLVRYLEEVKMDEALVESVLAYLKSDECVADLSLYDQKIAATWKPTRAWLEVSNKAVGNIKGVRLYHALIDASAKSGEGDGAYLIENGCAYKVSHTFFFNQPNPPTDADMAGKYKSTSGVSYQVGSLGVNPDTGLWNYVIEKRERVQQDVEKYATAETEFEKQEEEVHHGVKQDKIASTGKAAGVNNGVITHRKVTKNADCTSDVHNTYETEKGVKGASESVTVTRTGSTIETTNRSVSSPLPTDNLKVGESVTNTKTPAGKWNTVYRKHVKNALNWIAEACSKTIFSHSHSKTTNQANDPGFTHTEEAANGVIVKKSVRAEDDGSFTITEDKEEEKTVNNASVTKRVTLGGTEVREEHRNLKEAPSADNLQVGESLTVSKTNGGLWNAVKTKFTAVAAVLREACSKNVFSHTHTKVEVVTSDPGFSHVENVANGVITRKEVSRNDNGTWTVTTSTDKEELVKNSSVTVQKTLHGIIRTEETRGVDEALPDENLKIGESVRSTKTANGRYINVKTSVDNKSVGEISRTVENDIFYDTEDTIENKEYDDAKELPASSELSNNTITNMSSRLTGDGTLDVTTRKVVANEWMHENEFTQLRDQQMFDGIDNSVTVKIILYGNKKERPKYTQLKNQVVTVSERKNRFGLLDGEIRIVTDGRLKLKSNSANSGIYTYTKYGKRKEELEWADNIFKSVFIRKWTTQTVRRCGKYSDYLDDLSDEVSYGQEGKSEVELIRELNDALGNRYAEWKYVDRYLSQKFMPSTMRVIQDADGAIRYVGRITVKNDNPVMPST